MKSLLPLKPSWQFLLLFGLMYITIFSTYAQTPGLIFSPATSSGARVLDPNGDGYVSVQRTPPGFTSTRDEGIGFSEVPYRSFPALTTEPLGDLNTGSSGGHTDLAPPAAPITSPSTGSPISAYFDGTNLLFRIRLGGASTASKGYSVLIDSDGVFNGTGINPGFEYEVLLASNFAVQVINHGANGSPVIFSGAATQYSQKAVAASTSSGNADYFYDYYVPLTAFNGGITATTPLRMSGITITSAQSGLTGTVSDVGGVNFQAYNYNAPAAWRALLGSFPPTSLNQLQAGEFPPIAAIAPVVTGPIQANSTSISGTSTEAAGSVVSVFRNGVQICGGANQPACPTVNANGTWTLTGISSTLLTAGNTITATVTAPGKTVSGISNTVTVTAGLCTASPAPILTGMGGSGNQRRSFIGTTSFPTNQRITIYSAATNTSLGSFTYNPSTSTTGVNWTSPEYGVGEFNYYATVTPLDATGTVIGCESVRSNQICFRNGQPSVNNQTIAITSVTYGNTTQNSTTSPTWSEIPTTVSSISGTLSAAPASIASGTSGAVVLFINGVEQATPRFTISTASTTWTLGNLALNLAPGDILNVRTLWTLTGGGQTTCAVPSSASNLLNVQATTAAPVIAAPTCGRVITLSGTSTEPYGTVLQFYTGGTPGERNGTLITQSGTTTPITATVSNAGVWSVNFSAAADGGIAAGTPITARAKAPGKIRSVNSQAVSSTPAPAGVLVISPVTEGATSVSGTGPTSAAGGVITLYIDGTPFPTTTQVAANGSWTISGIAAQELFAGASVTATYILAQQCESARATPVIVTCSAPAVTFTLTANPTTICGAQTTTFTLSGSEYGVSYRLLIGGAESGSSVIGTGGPITLVSGPITNTTAANTTATITYRARKISGTACDATSTNSASVTVRPQPVFTSFVYTPSFQQICSNTSTSFSVQGTNANNNYQLINEATGQLVGTAVQGSTAAITLITGPVTTNTTYGLRITIRGDANACSVTLPNQVSVFTTGPSITRAVFPTANSVCVGGNTMINVSTQDNVAYTYRVFRRSNSQLIGAAFTGNGTIVQVPTGTLSTAGTETFYVTVTSTACGTQTLLNEASVTVTNNPVQANAGADFTVCGTTATMQGNNVFPSEGTWRQVSGPTTAGYSNPLNPNATISNLASGVYVFTWTVSTTCGGSTATTVDDVTITVNCPSIYTVAIPKYRDDYEPGEALATATDPDGSIIAAQITQGTLPPGMAFNQANGNFTVTNPDFLEEGSYPFTIRLTDSFDRVTVTTILIRIFGNSPVIVPFPVELVYFTGVVNNGSVMLQWLTASEVDNDRFEVERSSDGKAFEQIGTVKGKGNSNVEVKYNFRDSSPIAGTVYYRLKQVDFDGTFEYSRVIAINAQGIVGEMKVQVYPNPFTDKVTIAFTATEDATTQLQLHDMQGRVILTRQMEVREGVNELEVKLEQIPTGVYILKLTGGSIDVTSKLMKTR